MSPGSFLHRGISDSCLLWPFPTDQFLLHRQNTQREVSVSKKPKAHDPYISTYIRVSYSVLRVDISIVINRFAFFTP